MYPLQLFSLPFATFLWWCGTAQTIIYIRGGIQSWIAMIFSIFILSFDNFYRKRRTLSTKSNDGNERKTYWEKTNPRVSAFSCTAPRFQMFFTRDGDERESSVERKWSCWGAMTSRHAFHEHADAMNGRSDNKHPRLRSLIDLVHSCMLMNYDTLFHLFYSHMRCEPTRLRCR